ncbi:Rapid ALkalinization Factor [Corchorus olitorius]|uniref:Rapid ALkalinization Factor n=1 Tax=Corchorus olitorius TaxID=93759 RepID=A0A1R3IFN2_9ROSI|nr:Rapid ALkalinization Factor [Corchorus olitorius]
MVALLVLSGMVAGTPFINPGAMKKNKSPPTNSGSAPPAEPYQRGCIQANKCRGSSPSEKGGRKLLSVPLNSSYTLDNMLKILRNVKAIIL